MPVHLEEFLYRGRAKDSPDPPAWHIVLVAVLDDGLGGKALVHKTLNMQQAEDEGWGLPKVIDAINTDMLHEIELVRQQLTAKQDEIDKLTTDNAQAAVKLQELTQRLATAANEPVAGD